MSHPTWRLICASIGDWAPLTSRTRCSTTTFAQIGGTGYRRQASSGRGRGRVLRMTCSGFPPKPTPPKPTPPKPTPPKPTQPSRTPPCLCSAGLTGGRVNRFNLIKQSKDYDVNGDYVRRWCPELARVPAPKVSRHVELPVPLPALMPGPRPGLVPGLGLGLVPGLGPGLVPGLGPGLVPGLGPGLVPGLGPGLVPGLGPGLVPGLGLGLGPGPL